MPAFQMGIHTTHTAPHRSITPAAAPTPHTGQTNLRGVRRLAQDHPAGEGAGPSVPSVPCIPGCPTALLSVMGTELHE